MDRKFDDGLRVLAYGDVSKLEATMNGHFFNQLRLAADEMTGIPSTMDELNKHVCDGNFTHVLVPDEWFYKLDGTLEGCDVPVVEFLGDHWIPWAVNKKKKYMRDNDIQHAIVLSNRFQKPYNGMTNMHCVSYGYDSSVFCDAGKERDIDVLIHGSLGGDTHKGVYPVRNWLAEVLPEIGEREGIRVERWSHPGYWPKGESPKGGFTGLYAEVLNRSKIAIGGSSHWRLPLKKFYEVPACGAILLSDLPLEGGAFFDGRIIEVNPDRIRTPSYEDKIRERIVGVLANYEAAKERLQPFRSDQDRFDKSYEGRALEIRAVLSGIE